MSGWRIRNCYGSGAGRIPLAVRRPRLGGSSAPPTALLRRVAAPVALTALSLLTLAVWQVLQAPQPETFEPLEVRVVRAESLEQPAPLELALPSPRVVAAARVERREPEKPEIDALLARPVVPSPPRLARGRSALPAVSTAPRPSVVIDALPPRPDIAPVTAPAWTGATTAPPRAARDVRLASVGIPAAPRRAAVPQLPAPAVGLVGDAASVRTAGQHPAFVAVAPTDNYASAPSNADVRGASLGSLSACRTDAEEDLLKQRLLASVETQVSCKSDAGTYRFLETKNLNAFLMWVERSPERAEANRCHELRYAIACLAGRHGKESRES